MKEGGDEILSRVGFELDDGSGVGTVKGADGDAQLARTFGEGINDRVLYP